MPFQHTVLDADGRTHTRLSENRQYAFAVVVKIDGGEDGKGNSWGPRRWANWASNRKNAERSARQYRNAYGFAGAEIIPCDPIPVGRHK